MKKNMGGTDKLLRTLVAAIIAALFLTKVISGTLAIILLLVAAVFVLTSLFGVCPLYSLVGVKTCTTREATG